MWDLLLGTFIIAPRRHILVMFCICLDYLNGKISLIHQKRVIIVLYKGIAYYFFEFNLEHLSFTLEKDMYIGSR